MVIANTATGAVKMSKRQFYILVIAILASFVAFLDGSVVGVALPSISEQLGGGLLTQQWVNDAYLITLGSLILAAGSLSDIFGRKRILTVGLYGFMAASLLCAVAPSSLFLILARGLQGIAGALLVPSSLAIIIDVFSGKMQAKAIGSWTAWTGVAFIIGPLLGGLLVDLVSWRLVFAINVIPIVFALLLLRKVNIASGKQKYTQVDYAGIILGVIALGGVVYALIEQGHYGWKNPLIYGTFVIGLLAAIVFTLHERRTAHPMLPFEIFKNRNFNAGNLATFFIYSALSLQGFLLVIFLQQVAGYSATAAGMASIPITALLLFLSSRFGAISGIYGPRLFMTIGPIISGLGTLMMLSVRMPVHFMSQILPGVLVFGLGLAMTVAPLTSATLGSVKKSQAGISSAVNNAISRIAGLLAVAVIGMVIGGSITLSGFHAGMVVCGGLLIIGGIMSAIFVRNT